jgi:hypothetical protein
VGSVLYTYCEKMFSLTTLSQISLNAPSRRLPSASCSYNAMNSVLGEDTGHIRSHPRLPPCHVTSIKRFSNVTSVTLKAALQ